MNQLVLQKIFNVTCHICPSWGHISRPEVDVLLGLAEELLSHKRGEQKEGTIKI